MMKRTQQKDALRNIWKQKISFLSIAVIAMLGVTAFLSICFSAAALKANGSRIYNEQRFRDMEIVSTRLLTADDLQFLRGTEGVLDVEPLWQTGANVYAGDLRESVTVITVTERLNLPILKEGRLPAAGTECAVEQRLADKMGWQIGDVLDRLEATGPTSQYFLGDRFTITGIVDHPDHTNLNVPDSLYVLVTRDVFDHAQLDECCMKALVAVDAADDDRFSFAHVDSVEAVSARIEATAPERAALRDAQIRTQAQERIDEADAQLAEAKRTLDDSRRQLDDGWQKLDEGEQQFSDGERELQDAKSRLDDSQQQLSEAEQELLDARQQLDEAKAQLDQGKTALQSGGYQLDAARRELQDGWNTLEDAKETIRDMLRDTVESVSGEDSSDWIDWAGRQEADISDSDVTAKELWITGDMKVNLDMTPGEMAVQAIHSADIPDEILRSAYEGLYGNDPAAPNYDPLAIQAYLAAQASTAADEAASDYAQLVNGCARWDEGHRAYLRGSALYYSNRKQFNKAMADYLAGEEKYSAGLAAYEEGLAKFTEGKEAYEKGVRDLETARKEIADGRKELEDGERQYADGLAAYEDGLRQRNAAAEELDAMEPGRWIVLDDHGNASFVQLRLASDNLSSLLMTFSLLFVIIGAMVIYSTISKMVDEQRPLVGTTKALGFFNREIFAKYLLFGLSATLLGTLLGLLAARFGIERFILNSNNIFYIIDIGRPVLEVKPTLAVILGSVLLAVAAVFFACWRLVRTPAIRLMQAPVPKSRQKAGRGGKHLLSLYSRLVLLNIRSDIKRVLVTVISVAGCCALVVIGFTLKFSLSGTLKNQYGAISLYDGRIRFEDGDGIAQQLREDQVAYVPLYNENVTFQIQDMDIGELLCGDIAAIEQMQRLDDWHTGTPLSPTDQGLLIQRRIAEVYGLDVGSEFEISLGVRAPVTVRVAGIFENYVGRLMVMSPAYYESLFAEAPAYNAFFVRFDGADQQAILSRLQELPGFVDYTPADEGKAIFVSATAILDLIVLIFIGMAALMAGVVQMNLTNIYILQKKRELTVMRINGFTTREVISYVTRETVATTVMGILLGWGVGSAIGNQIVRSLEQSFIHLDRGLCLPGWGFAAALTVFFTVIINVIVLRKVKDLKLTELN